MLAHRGPDRLFLSLHVPASGEVVPASGQGGGGGHLCSTLDTVTAVEGRGGGEPRFSVQVKQASRTEQKGAFLG